MRLSDDQWSDVSFSDIARTALTAAAEAEQMANLADEKLVNSPNARAVAAEVGDYKFNQPKTTTPSPTGSFVISTAAADPALCDFIRDTPISEPNDGWAAEEQSDGLPLKYTDKDLDDVVERCAKLAEGYPNDAFHGEMIAHSIRALKDKP